MDGGGGRADGGRHLRRVPESLESEPLTRTHILAVLGLTKKG